MEHGDNKVIMSDTSVCKQHILTHILPWHKNYYHGSHTFYDKKFEDFSRTFQDCQNVFPDLFGARQCLNIKTNSSYLLYIITVPYLSTGKQVLR